MGLIHFLRINDPCRFRNPFKMIGANISKEITILFRETISQSRSVFRAIGAASSRRSSKLLKISYLILL